MKGLKHFQNKTLETLLTEMCKRVNVDPDDIDFNEHRWFMKHTWTEEEQDEFKRWMNEYLTKNKKAVDEIAAFPNLVKHNKRELIKLINWFILDFGWCTEYEKKRKPI